MGAPLGNKNPTKGKLWKAAIDRALKKRSLEAKRDALDDLAEKFLSLCDKEELQAFKELADRLDGKASQPITGEDGGPLVVELVKYADTDSG